MKMRFLIVSLLLAGLSLVPARVLAQENKIIDNLLAQPAAAYAETAYLAVLGGAWLKEGASPLEAFEFAQRKGWIGKSAKPEKPIDLESFAVLAMRGLRVRGGAGWSLFGGKRYAYRELVAYSIVNETGGKKRNPSGEEVIRMIAAVSEMPRRKK